MRIVEASDHESDTVVVSTDCETGKSIASTSPISQAAKALVFTGKPQGNLPKWSVDTGTSRLQVHPLPLPFLMTSKLHRKPSVTPVVNLWRGKKIEEAHGRGSSSRNHANYIRPYDELREAEEQADNHPETEVVLPRLVPEWQAVGQMLIGLAAVNAAVIGFVRGSTTFTVDDFSLGVVAIGAIAAGLGMAMDAWFFLLFSGADATRFKQLAKDVYGTYFFACLVWRLPTIHMLVSVLALGLFPSTRFTSL